MIRVNLHAPCPIWYRCVECEGSGEDENGRDDACCRCCGIGHLFCRTHGTHPERYTGGLTYASFRCNTSKRGQRSTVTHPGTRPMVLASLTRREWKRKP